MEWVSVNDKLPEKSGEYLTADVRMAGGYIRQYPYSARYHVFNVHDDDSRERADETAIPVTHWMPLPEPPAGCASDADGLIPPSATAESERELADFHIISGDCCCIVVTSKK